MSEEKLKKLLESSTVEELRANSEVLYKLIKESNIPMYGFFLKDYELNSVLCKKGKRFRLLREEKNSYIVEMEKEQMHISLPKKLEEKVFVF